MNWFVLALLSAIFFGFENFLYKVSAKYNFNSAKISSIFGLTVCALGLFAFFIFHETILNLSFLIFISVLNSLFFFSSIITKFEALKKVEVSFFYPVNRIGGLFLLLIISFLFLRESITSMQFLGLILTIFVLYLLTKEEEKELKKNIVVSGIILTGISTLLVTFANVTTKFVANFGTFSFIFISYGLGFIFSFLANNYYFKSKESKSGKGKKYITIYTLGITMGILNFLGISTLVTALSSGSLSLVITINSFSLLITLLLAVYVYSEKLSPRKIIGIVLSFIALFLLK